MDRLVTEKQAILGDGGVAVDGPGDVVAFFFHADGGRIEDG